MWWRKTLVHLYQVLEFENSSSNYQSGGCHPLREWSKMWRHISELSSDVNPRPSATVHRAALNFFLRSNPLKQLFFKKKSLKIQNLLSFLNIATRSICLYSFNINLPLYKFCYSNANSVNFDSCRIFVEIFNHSLPVKFSLYHHKISISVLV